MATTAATTSSFIGTRLPEIHTGSGRIQARFGFGFGTKKSPPPPPPPKKTVPKPSSDRPTWFPGAQAPEWLDGSLVGDVGFDPFGLGKPAEYLQFDFDSLDQNLAKNEAGDIIGIRTETSDVQPTPFQPYTEVFGLQRFRECELIHGRWAMLATLGALSVEWLTGVTWQDAGKEKMGRIFLIYLEGCMYSCKYCQAPLALVDDLISKWFHCRHGNAYLFNKVFPRSFGWNVNVTVGKKEDRMMTTGLHTVVDIFCVGCGSIVGWKYEAAHVVEEKYKEGKFILERFKVRGPDGTDYMISNDE